MSDYFPFTDRFNLERGAALAQRVIELEAGLVTDKRILAEIAQRIEVQYKHDEREWITTFANDPFERYSEHRKMLDTIESQAAELRDARAVIVAAREALEFLPDDDAIDAVPPGRSVTVDAASKLRKALDLCWTRG